MKTCKVDQAPVSRLQVAVTQILDVLSALAAEQVKHKENTCQFNIMLFGTGLELIKWQHRPVDLNFQSLEAVRSFLVDHAKSTRSTRAKRKKNDDRTTDKVLISALKDISKQSVAILADISTHVVCACDSVSKDLPYASAMTEFKASGALKKLAKSLVANETCGQETSQLSSSSNLLARSLLLSETKRISQIARQKRTLLDFVVLGSAGDNRHRTLKSLTYECKVQRRWISDSGEIYTFTASHKTKKECDMIKDGRSDDDIGFWFQLVSEKDPGVHHLTDLDASRKLQLAHKAKAAFDILCRAFVRAEFTLEAAYDSFDTNRDGTVSVSKFLSVLRPLLEQSRASRVSGPSHGPFTPRRFLRFSRIEEYRLWRCIDRDGSGVVSLSEFAAFFDAACKNLDLPTLERISRNAEIGEKKFYDETTTERAKEETCTSRCVVESISSFDELVHVAWASFSRENETNFENDQIPDTDINGDDEARGDDEASGDDETSGDDEASGDESEEEKGHERRAKSLHSEGYRLTPSRETAGDEALPTRCLNAQKKTNWQLPCFESAKIGMGLYFEGFQLKTTVENDTWEELCKAYSVDHSKDKQGIDYVIARARTCYGASRALNRALYAANMYLLEGPEDTPGLVFPRTQAAQAARATPLNSSNADLKHSSESIAKLVFSETSTTIMMEKHLEYVDARNDKSLYGQAGGCFATCHPLDMNEWLRGSVDLSSAAGELAIAAPLVDHDEFWCGCTDSPARSWFTHESEQLGSAPMDSIMLRTVARASELVGEVVYGLDDFSSKSEIQGQKVLRVVALPQRGKGKQFGLALVTENGVFDISPQSREGKLRLGRAEIFVPASSGDSSPGYSDGERLMPPGSLVPLARFWGPLRCYSVGVFHCGINFAQDDFQRVLLKVPSWVPFQSDLNPVTNKVMAGPPGSRVQIDFSKSSMTGLAQSGYQGVTLRTRVDDERVKIFRFDSDSLNALGGDHNEHNESKNVLGHAASAKTPLIAIGGRGETVCFIEVPPDLVFAKTEENDNQALLRIGQELWSAACAQRPVTTASGLLAVTIPVIGYDSGFAPVRGAPGTRLRTTLQLDENGCSVRSYCAGAWGVQRSVSGFAHPTCKNIAQNDSSRLDETTSSSQSHLDATHRTYANAAEGRVLDDDSFVFSRPFLCFVVEKDGSTVACSFLVGRDAWVRAPVPPPPRNLNAVSSLPLASHQGVRSPSRRYLRHAQVQRPPRAQSDLIGRNLKDNTDLYRVPANATTREIIYLVQQALRETMERSAAGISLSGFFNVFCQSSTDLRKSASKRVYQSTPGGKQQCRGPVVAQREKHGTLSRKDFYTGLRQVLGIKVPWTHSNALFNHISGKSDVITKSTFVRAFRRNDPHLQLGKKNGQTDWMREALYDIADAMMEKGIFPWQVVPDKGLSMAEFVRFIGKGLGIGLEKGRMYQLLSAMDNSLSRRITTNEDFCDAMLVVHSERLQDLLAVSREWITSHGSNSSSRKRLRAIHAQIALIEQVVRQEQLQSFLKSLEHSMRPNARAILDAALKGKQILAHLERLSGSTAQDGYVREKIKLDAELSITYDSFESLVAASQDALAAETSMHSQRSVLQPTKRAALAELRCSWCHVSLHKVRQTAFPMAGPFSSLLVKAGMDPSLSFVANVGRSKRLERLHAILKRTEANMPLISSRTLSFKAAKLHENNAQVRQNVAQPVVDVHWDAMTGVKNSYSDEGTRFPQPFEILSVDCDSTVTKQVDMKPCEESTPGEFRASPKSKGKGYSDSVRTPSTTPKSLSPFHSSVKSSPKTSPGNPSWAKSTESILTLATETSAAQSIPDPSMHDSPASSCGPLESMQSESEEEDSDFKEDSDGENDQETYSEDDYEDEGTDEESKHNVNVNGGVRDQAIS